MNYNIASGILFDMLVESEKYENKNVKVKGEFVSEMHDKNRLYAVLIWDATGCCPRNNEISRGFSTVEQ